MTDDPIDNPTPYLPPEPQPLVRPSGKYVPAPVDDLPHIIRGGVLGIADKVQCAPEIALQSVLCASSLVAQGHVNVRMIGGRVRPCSLFLLTIAESGDRKTSADAEAMDAAFQKEQQMQAESRSEVARFKAANEAWQLQHRQIVNEAADPAQLRTELEALGPAPEPPVMPVLISTEGTWEGLQLQFEKGPGTAALASSEGGQLFGGHAFGKDHKLKTGAGLSSIWDGDPVRRTRRGDGISVLHNRRLTTHLMVQEIVSNIFLSDPLLLGQGLISRFLVTQPDSRMGARLFRKPSDASLHGVARLSARLSDLLSRDLPLVEDTQNELAPRTLEPNAHALEALIVFHDEIEKQLAPNGRLRPVSGFAAKLTEHAARLAAVFRFIEEPNAETIDAHTMTSAITLARWYAGESIRLFDAGSMSAEIRSAEKVRDWLVNRWDGDFISNPDVQQFGPNFMREKEPAQEAIAILEAHGWLIPTDAPGVIRGKNRRKVWRIVRPA